MENVEVKNVSKHYRSGDLVVKAIDELSLAIGTGEFAVIAGSSGSGKTTLLNLIGGLDNPTSGEVFIDGESLKEKSADDLARLRLKKIGFVFQSYNLIPVLSAYENVQFILQIQGVPDSEHKDRIMPILKELGIEGMEHRRPQELSGGQQQRVAVARAMVGHPTIILADEPTANLDSESSLKLLNMMRNLNELKGVTFLFSSHDPDVINIAKRVIKLKDGKIISDTSDNLT